MSPRIFNSIGYDPVEQLRQQDVKTRNLLTVSICFYKRRFRLSIPYW